MYKTILTTVLLLGIVTLTKAQNCVWLKTGIPTINVYTTSCDFLYNTIDSTFYKKTIYGWKLVGKVDGVVQDGTVSGTDIILDRTVGADITIDASSFARADNLKFTDGTDPLDAVYTTGNVGIGNTDPQHLLDISTNSNANITMLKLKNTNAANSSANPQLDIENGDGSMLRLKQWTDNAQGGRSEIRATNNLLLISDGGSASIISEGETYAFTDTGIGFGTSTPEANIHLINETAGQNIIARFDTDAANSSVESRIELGAAAAEAYINLTSSNFGGEKELLTFGNSGNITFNATKGEYRFKGNEGTINHMVIDTFGNVGIGVDEPTATLDINGSINANGLATFENTDDGNIIGKLKIDYKSSDNPTISSIGGDYIELKTDLELYNTGIYGGTSSTSGIRIGTKRVNTPIVFNTSPITQSTYVEAMRVAGDGNIGIGTDTPLSTLHINGGVGNLSTGLSFGAGTSGFYESSNNVLEVQIGGAPKFQFSASALSASFGAGPQISNSTVSETNPTFRPNKTDLNTGIGWVSSDIGALVAGGVNVLNWDISGNVGIGTTAPDNELHVEGSGLFDLFSNSTPLAGEEKGIFFREGFSTSNTYNLSLTLYDHTTEGTGSTDGFSINGYDGVSICTGSNTRQERFRVTTSGDIGINNIDPQYLIDVGGTEAVIKLEPNNTVIAADEGLIRANSSTKHLQYDDGTGLADLAFKSEINKEANVSVITTNVSLTPTSSTFIKATVPTATTYTVTLDDVGLIEGAYMSVFNNGLGDLVLDRLTGDFETIVGTVATITIDSNSTAYLQWDGSAWFKIY